MISRAIRTRYVGGAIGLVLAGGMLTGCGSDVPPGAAAVVDGHTISRAKVAQLVDAQCAALDKAAKSGSGQPSSRRSIAQNWVGTLIDARSQLAFGSSQGVSPRASAVAASYARVKPTIDALPTKYHAVLDSTLHQILQGQDVLLQVGEKASGTTASASNSEQVLNAGYAKWKKAQGTKQGVTVHTDARYSYGTSTGGGSVSTPVSSFAKSAAKQQPSASYVAGLPEGQRCG